LKRSQTFAAQDIRAALDQTNLRTPFGPVQFKAYGKYERQNSRSTLVLQNIENNYECIWPEDLSVAKFVMPAR
jgi:branched-chain amino acid transport system substrate-binding protein